MKNKALKKNQLCPPDLPNIGALCKRIRESRGVSASEIADACGVKRSTITRNFEELGSASDQLFACYIDALCSGLVKRLRPLTLDQVDMLKDLFDKRKNVKEQQMELQELDFATIRLADKPRPLEMMIESLKAQKYPAFIMDDLWFIHAFNGACLRLFGIAEDSGYLERWEAWHVVASKFYPDSPTRRVHASDDEYLGPTIAYFFREGGAYEYLFTRQMRELVCKMIELSTSVDSGFIESWIGATSFSIRYKLNFLTRTILYKGRPIQTGAYIDKVAEVRVGSDQSVRYTLAGWQPVGTDARSAFAEISRLHGSNKIFYAADYDKGKAFHVNDWPQISEYLNLLEK